MAEQAESCYQNVCVYGSYVSGLSALVVTSTGDVFGAGVNSLVWTFESSGVRSFPMVAGGGEVLSEWQKINKLCGLGIRKIIVACYIGVALTNTDAILIWGKDCDLPNLIDEQAVVMIQSVVPHRRCQLCTTAHNYTENVVGKAALNYCELTKTYPTYSPLESLSARKFLKYSIHSVPKCSKCDVICSPKEVNSVQLCYCKGCDLLWDVDDNVGVAVSQKTGIFFKRIRVEGGIVDVAPAWNGIWMLTASNKLVYKGCNRAPAWEEFPARNPNNVRMKAVSVCDAGTFVTSEDGGLYRCELVNGPDPGDYYILEKVSLPADVTKVCGGYHVALCMLSDNSVYILYSKDHPPQRVVCEDGADTFLDIAVAQWEDTFYIQACKSSILKFSHPLYYEPKITCKIGESNCNKRLLEEVCTQPIPFASATPTLPDSTQLWRAGTSPPAQSLPGPSSQPGSTPPSHNSSPLPAFLIGLYGQNLLSDTTLRLSDGDIPAHRCVLMTTSAYFNKKFSSRTANSQKPTLDFSSYNPSAFRCLLKYFYQQPLDELNLDGLFDLCQLANIFGEIFLARETGKQIKGKVNMANAPYVYALSKLFGYEQIEKHCANFMKTAEFKDKLLDKLMRDPTIFLLHPDTETT